MFHLTGMLLAGRRREFLAIALFAPAAVFANDAIAERVLTAYTSLEGYCDTVTLQSHELALELRRCYTRDGRYKRIEQVARNGYRDVRWGDVAHAYSWSTLPDGSTNHYAEQPARTFSDAGHPEGLAARVLSPFLPSERTDDQARDTLRSMDAIENGAETIILQRQHKSPAGTNVVDRVWVRQADGFVVRAEETWDGRVASSATLVEARANPTLTRADLTESAPFFQRYSLKTRPMEFTGGLALLSFLVGIALSVGWRRPRNWRRIWLVYAKGIGITIALLVVLALLSLGSGGHPPAIVVPMILGLLAGVAALTLAALMLGIQMGDRTVRMVQRGSTGPLR